MDAATTAAVRDHLDAIIPMKLPGALRVVLGVNEIRHPIPGEIMARLAGNPRTLKLAKILLRSDDLRLREQILSRTDPIPPPYSNSYHIDAPFLLEEYEATPRQIYFQLIQYCSTVTPGGAGVMIIPRSHKLTYAVNQGARTESDRRFQRTRSRWRELIQTTASRSAPTTGICSYSMPCVSTVHRATGRNNRVMSTSPRSTIHPQLGW